MLEPVYQTRLRRPLPIDPVEHAAREIHAGIDELINAVNSADLPTLRRIEQLLKPLAVGILSVQDVLAHREYQQMVQQ